MSGTDEDFEVSIPARIPITPGEELKNLADTIGALLS
jgi:hypothetical protein